MARSGVGTRNCGGVGAWGAGRGRGRASTGNLGGGLRSTCVPQRSGDGSGLPPPAWRTVRWSKTQELGTARVVKRDPVWHTRQKRKAGEDTDAESISVQTSAMREPAAETPDPGMQSLAQARGRKAGQSKHQRLQEHTGHGWAVRWTLHLFPGQQVRGCVRAWRAARRRVVEGDTAAAAIEEQLRLAPAILRKLIRRMACRQRALQVWTWAGAGEQRAKRICEVVSCQRAERGICGIWRSLWHRSWKFEDETVHEKYTIYSVLYQFRISKASRRRCDFQRSYWMAPSWQTSSFVSRQQRGSAIAVE